MKFKSKTLIIDDGKVRGCYSNYAKLSMKELMYCRLFIWKTVSGHYVDIFDDLIESLKELKDFFISIFSILINIILIPIIPILLYRQCKQDKKQAITKIWKDKCYLCCNYHEPEKWGKSDGEICSQCDIIDGEPSKYIRDKNKKSRW